MPQEHLALMMGVSRQTINKALRTLEASGAIALRYAEIELIDAGALQRLAQR
jgi:CRP/FNR family cyclic AMP-dependent transcriptional regulator